MRTPCRSTTAVGGFDGKKVDNLLFYEDPDYGFVMNALIKNPGGRAMVHDHGPAWTIYGVVEGRERIVRYAASGKGDGSVDLKETDSKFCNPGDVDIVEPSSWSCAHGVARWMDDCGCHTGGEPGWTQAWRAPLRAAFDRVRDWAVEVFERRGKRLTAVNER